MNVKQKNLRVFELFIENEEDFFPYMEKNLPLLVNYLLLIKGDELTPKMREYLEDNGCCFKETQKCNLNLQTKEPKEEKPSQKIEVVYYKEEESEGKTKQDTMALYTPIRSGSIIESDKDITIFGRVNSGAKVICGGNLTIFGTIDGVVECEGEYMVLKDIGKGFAIFNGDILEKEEINGSLKRVRYLDGELNIEEIV
ncbi:MAG: hypothetical protein DSZ06_01150 [Sulfurospirillum sp.]|nr:MAG: hypothetical protein DSZ06_01150 [Sulfurospirillum sp.]